MENFIHWNIDPIMLKLGPLQIHWYGLIFATGLLGGFYITEWMAKREGKDTKDLEPLFLYIVIGMVVGARLAHCLFYDFNYYAKHPLEILYIWKGGLASHGGFLGVILALYLYSKKYKTFSLSWLLSRGSIVAMFIATFIRIGNFFNSELVGKKSDFSFAVVFDRVDNFPRHAVVLYESFSYFLIFLILLFLYKKLSYQKFTKIAFGLVLILGFGARVFLEQFKTTQSEFVKEYSLLLSMGQILSLPFIAIGIILLIKGLKSDKLSS